MEKKKKRCELCGKMKFTEPSIFNGEYCIECYEALIEVGKEAIDAIKRRS